MRAEEKPDEEGGRDGWARTLRAAASMTGPMTMFVLAFLCKCAAVADVIPVRWDGFDSLAAFLFLGGAFLLILRHAAHLAQHAELVERQRQDWAARSACVIRGSDEDAMKAVRKLVADNEIRDLQYEIMRANHKAVCKAAGMGWLGDNLLLEAVPCGSRDRGTEAG